MNVPEWISAIANIAIAIGLLLTWKQLKVSQSTLADDHERSRREKAIDLISGWAKDLNAKGAAARKLSEKLSFEQVSKLFNQEPFELEQKYKDLLYGAVVSRTDDIKDGKIQVNAELSSELRWQVVTYLNNLEAILSAWKHNVADKEIIEEQFSYLVSHEKNQYILQDFRRAAGGNSTYPAIQLFVDELKSKESSKGGKKKIA